MFVCALSSYFAAMFLPGNAGFSFIFWQNPLAVRLQLLSEQAWSHGQRMSEEDKKRVGGGMERG